MTLTTDFIVEAGRRRSSTGFVPDWEAYEEHLPGYTKEQITEVGVHRFKVER